MTPLVMVMGFADSMQMVSAIRIRLREGDTKAEAVRFAVRVVGPACVLAHGTALLSFAALLVSQSGLIRTFGMAGMLATGISFVAVILVLPLLGLILIRNEGKLAKDRAPAIPNVRISPDCENSSARNDSSATPCASTQAGPTTCTAKRSASPLE